VIEFKGQQAEGEQEEAEERPSNHLDALAWRRNASASPLSAVYMAMYPGVPSALKTLDDPPGRVVDSTTSDVPSW
jgi:hypothetical protein